MLLNIILEIDSGRISDKAPVSIGLLGLGDSEGMGKLKGGNTSVDVGPTLNVLRYRLDSAFGVHFSSVFSGSSFAVDLRDIFRLSVTTTFSKQLGLNRTRRELT